MDRTEQADVTGAQPSPGGQAISDALAAGAWGAPWPTIQLRTGPGRAPAEKLRRKLGSYTKDIGVNIDSRECPNE